MKWVRWTNLVIGIWLMSAPWLLSYATRRATVEDTVLGLALVVSALWSAMLHETDIGPAAVNIVLALWILSAHYIIGYGPVDPVALTVDIATGLLVGVLAIVRLGAVRRIPLGPLDGY